jgi:CubicO group peptidase (beta-lactamase class C family)
MMFSRRELLHGAAIAGGSALAFGAFPQLCTASALPQVTPGEIQIDPRRLQVAYDLMEKWTTGPKAPVPGGAILVGRFGKILAPHFFGRQGPEPDAEPIRNDAMFYMASVTKPVIFTAAMLLVERGQLNLNDPVSRYVPEFTGQGREKVLVLHLFTHTSGLPDELPRNGELRSRQVSLARFVEEILKTELLFAPGTQFSYSSSGTILTAEIVQRLSGRSIRDFVRTQILEPLEMRSSGLGAQGFAPERLVRTTVPDYQIGNPGSWNTKYWREFGSPAGGLFSTPEDYARICVMMLGGGKLGDVRLLSPASVRMMTTNRSNDLPDLPETTRRTQPWGLGWRLNHPGTSESWSDLLSRKVFGHTGSAGNIVWMDPQTQTFCVILTNYLRSRAPWRLVHLSNAIAAAIM